MALIRGRGLGLELMMAGSDFDSALAELEAKLAERPGFYRGSPATAVVGPAQPSEAQVEALRALLHESGIELRGVEQAGEELERRRALRPKRETRLSESAKSLVADFAGARADIAERRKRGETSVRRVQLQSKPELPVVTVPAAQLAPPAAGTHYHVGTLRGGQALHNVGNIVVVGDVNPGTELVATGDIVVFGRLLGVAHAGAQGDDGARVYALSLQATQLRIATCIAVDEGARSTSTEPEVAIVREGRIVIVPFSKAAEVIA
ncbi:MAG TPA: septum site-determining protein MinC [Candidatus Baltobacteraceae bacterium]|nr:septum site-determining protein MinC [Candidatus Baltobacteraceae bacterium]